MSFHRGHESRERVLSRDLDPLVRFKQNDLGQLQHSLGLHPDRRDEIIERYAAVFDLSVEDIERLLDITPGF